MIVDRLATSKKFHQDVAIQACLPALPTCVFAAAALGSLADDLGFCARARCDCRKRG